MSELDEVRTLRLKLKAAKALIRDLGIAVARCEEALERQARTHNNAQPEEAQRDHQDEDLYCAAA
jgi:hypothetical protein